MVVNEPFSLPPEQAIKWFGEKGYALSFDWRDMWADAHARAFTVAKVAQLDVLADIREAVDSALTSGESLGEFKKRLRPELQKKGWWGEKEVVDPKTGEVTVAQLGSAHRLKVIYDTNLRTAHAAGKWQRIQDNAVRRPYLRYVARRPGKNRRDEHQGFNDIVRPVGDPFWDTHYGPNGWGCQCTVQQLNDRDLTRYKLKVSKPVKLQYRSYTNKRTGEVTRVPKGIGPGWEHNVGKGRAGQAVKDMPVLTPSQNFKDYDRPPAAKIEERKESPPLLKRAPKGKGKSQFVRDNFRSVFGTNEKKQSVEIADPTGVQVTFDERVLPAHIARGSGREQYLQHARNTVEDPLEIWLVPHRLKDGSVVIRQRYIGLHKSKDGTEDT